MCFLLELHWFYGRLTTAEDHWPLDTLFFWESAWNIIAGMKSLQSLRIEFLNKHIPNELPRLEALASRPIWSLLIGLLR